MFKGHRILQDEDTEQIPIFIPESQNDTESGTFIFGGEDDDEEESEEPEV